MSRRSALIGALLAIAAVAALIVLSGGEGDDEKVSGDSAIGKREPAGPETREPMAKTAVLTIVVGKDGKPEGGVAELTFEKDERVRFKVESAVADEIHVHGYGLMKDVEAGGAVSFDFPADLEGIFEAELEDRGEQILELRVEP